MSPQAPLALTPGPGATDGAISAESQLNGTDEAGIQYRDSAHRDPFAYIRGWETELVGIAGGNEDEPWSNGIEKLRVCRGRAAVMPCHQDIAGEQVSQLTRKPALDTRMDVTRQEDRPTPRFDAQDT
jgi:hypothetical protein